MPIRACPTARGSRASVRLRTRVFRYVEQQSKPLLHSFPLLGRNPSAHLGDDDEGAEHHGRDQDKREQAKPVAADGVGEKSNGAPDEEYGNEAKPKGRKGRDKDGGPDGAAEPAP